MKWVFWFVLFLRELRKKFFFLEHKLYVSKQTILFQYSNAKYYVPGSYEALSKCFMNNWI